ncbi:MAG: DNA polymerase domain-containing protein [Candidatus Aenigmatarchaeota archaeon]
MLIQILDVDYFLNGNKPVIRVFGKKPDGSSVCCLCDTFLPYFYIEKNSDVWEKVDSMKLNYEEVDMFYPIGHQKNKTTVFKISLQNPRDVPEIRKTLEPYGKCFDADILFKYRFMVDHDIRGMCWVDVEESKIFTKVAKVPIYKINSIKPLDNQTIAPLRFMCLDIECLQTDMSREIDAKKDPIIMVALAFSPAYKKNDTLVLVSKPFSGEKVQSFSNEKDMLEGLIKIIQEYDPDILTGYNINGFDLPYLINRFSKYGIYADISRCEKPAFCRQFASTQEVSITGRVVIDPYQILKRDPMIRFARYNLNTVAKEMLSEVKDDVVVGDMYKLWNSTRANLLKLIEYSRKDAILALKLVEQKQMLDKFIEISRVSGVLLQDALGGQTVRIENTCLHEFKKRSIMFPVKPDDRELIEREKDKIKGATVLEPEKGLHKNVIVLDFQSLYPSIIIKYNISPDTLIKNTNATKIHQSPTGATFLDQSIHEGAFPSILKNLLITRQDAKKKMKTATGDEKRLLNAKQQALKIMANSFYGYLGYIRARLYVSENANAVTGYGRDTIQKAKNIIENDFDFKVVYGDTDSLFVKSKKDHTESELKELGIKISKTVSEKIGLFFDFEKVYKSFLILTKKRYAGTKMDGTGMDMKGIETVRRDWCPLVTETMLRVLETILKENDIEKALIITKDTIKQLYANAIPVEKLTIVKGITKSIGAYDGIQPHIEVAKKIGNRNPAGRPKVGDRVGYVIVRGNDLLSKRAEDPEYVKTNSLSIDSEYYINNQLLPPIERIFSALGIEKTELLGSGRQMNIFEMLKTGGLLCTDCNKSYRRMPMRGACECGGHIK